MRAPRREVSAVTHMYDLALWLLSRVADFPRNHRFTLGDRIETRALEALELLAEPPTRATRPPC